MVMDYSGDTQCYSVANQLGGAHSDTEKISSRSQQNGEIG